MPEPMLKRPESPPNAQMAENGRVRRMVSSCKARRGARRGVMCGVMCGGFLGIWPLICLGVCTTSGLSALVSTELLHLADF